MRIKDILLLQEAPRYATVAWAKPINDSVLLNIYNKGEWHPINGSGSNSGSSSSDSCWDVEIVVRGNSAENAVAILKKGNFNNIVQRLLDGIAFSARVINVTADGTWTELPIMNINPSDSTPVIYISCERSTINWYSDNTLTLSNGGSSPK